VAKINFQELLLAKGEKMLLIVGGVGLGGLLLWSVASALGGPASPSTTVKTFDGEASRIEGAVRSTAESTIEDIPVWVKKDPGFALLDSRSFAMQTPVFEPTTEPSKLRDLPPVLTPVPYEQGGGVQYNLIRAPMPAYDVRVDNGKVTIGVLSSVKVSANDKDTLNRFRKGAKQLTQQPRPMNPGAGGFAPGAGGFAPGAGGFAPGSGGPGGGGPGGGQGGGVGTPDGGGGGPRGGGGMGAFGGFNAADGRTETFVRYVTPEQFDKDPSLVPAVTVYPLRMLSVQMAFPLKQQFEEIRKALKLQTLNEAIAASNYNQGGLFQGIEVERREILPDGTVFEWAAFNHEEIYRNTIRNRKLGDVEDDGYAAYYTYPAYLQRLAAPYPILAEGLGGYETITLNVIADSIEKLKALNRPKIDREKSKFEGGTAAENPFAPSSAAGLGGGGAAGGGLFAGGGIGSAMGPGVGFAGPRGGGMSGGVQPPTNSGSSGGDASTGGPGAAPGGPRGMPGNPRGGPPGAGPGSPDGFAAGPGMPMGATGQMSQMNPNDPKYYPLNEDFLLIRFLDPTIRPGHSYQYRVRVVMKNPNLKMDALVSQPDFAKKEKIESPNWTVPGTATIPPETYVYAQNQKKYEEKVKEKYQKNAAMQELLLPKEGKTVVQIHQWAPSVRLNANTSEPIGTWIIGEVPVGPGEFVGRKHLVSLPTWSAERSAYALKELPGGIKLKPPARETPKGWLVDLTSASVLVDFEGGKYRGTVSGNTVQDESDVELLIVRPDGSVTVRNSAADATTPARESREKNWNEWLKKAEEQGNRMTQTGTGAPGAGGGQPGGGDR
jgi:hypothetical protein